MPRANPFGRILLSERNLPHKVDIQRQVMLNDDAGGVIPQPTTIARRVPAWVQPISGQEQAEFARSDLVYTDKVIFFRKPNVINGDIIVFQDRNLVVKGSANELELDRVWTIMTRDVNVPDQT